MSDDDADDVLPIPAWRPALHHCDAALGVADVHVAPYEQDVPTQHVRQGRVTRAPVAKDTGTARERIYERLKHTDALARMGRMVEQVRRRRRGACPTDPVTPFPQPTRVTLHEYMLEPYVRELADRTVPLARVAQRVPHGVRGERLLDLMWRAPRGSASAPAYQVPIPRAVWFIRMQCAQELHALERRGATDAAQYTCEWTHTVLQWLRHALDQPRSSPDVWADRWTYATSLVHALLDAHLLEPHVLYRWLTQQLSLVRGAPRACILQLTAQHIRAILSHAALRTPLVCALVSAATEPSWVGTQASDLLGFCARTTPAAFVHARAFMDDTRRLFPLLGEEQERVSTQAELLHTALFPLLPHAKTWDVAGVHLLDAPAAITALFMDFFLTRESTTHAGFVQRRLMILYEWACTHKRWGIHNGVHRVYIASALVRLLDECQSHRLVARDGRLLACPWKAFSIADATQAWVDALPDTTAPTFMLAASRLLGALATQGLFDYMRFLHLLKERGAVRRGNEARAQPGRLDSHGPLRLFCQIPIQSLSPVQLQQRRVAIYGMHASESTEEAVERRAIRELEQLFKWGTDEAVPASPATPLTPSELAAQVPSRDAPAPTTGAGAQPPDAGPTRAPTADILDALQLRSRLPNVWAASPYVQARVVDQYLAPMLMHDVSALQADGFAMAAAILVELHAMDALGRLMCALLDGHNLSCVISVCHTAVTYARVWDALGIATELVERIVPYAIAEPIVQPGIERIVPTAGRGMAVGMARRALARFGTFDVRVPTYAPMLQAPVVTEPQSYAAQLFDALYDKNPSDACAPLAQSIPFDAAAAHLLVHALDRLAQSPAFPPAVLTTYIATLAGTVGVRLDDVVHAWIERAWSDPHAHMSSRWTVLVLGLVRHDAIDATRLLQAVLVPFIERAPADHAGWDACMALLYTLVFTYTQQGMACSIGVVGDASWYDVSLIRTALAWNDGFVPLLAALDLCEAPQRWACWNVLACQVHKLQNAWMAYPDAVWRGIQAMRGADRFQRVRRLISTFTDQEHVGRLPQPRMASVLTPLRAPRLNVNDLFEGALATLEWRLVLEESRTLSPDTGALLLAPHSCRAPLDLVFQWDPSPRLFHTLLTHALDCFVRERASRDSIAALAHLMYVWRTTAPLECPPDLAARAVDTLTRLPDHPLVLRAAAILSVLRCAPRVASHAWLAVLHGLCDEDSALARAVAAHIECALDPHALDPWLRARAAAAAAAAAAAGAAAPSSDPLRKYSSASASPTLPVPWDWHDSLRACAPAAPDPWGVALHNDTSIPLSLFQAVKTRERLPVVGDTQIMHRAASERSYGDGDDAASRYRRVLSTTSYALRRPGGGHAARSASSAAAAPRPTKRPRV